MSHECPDCYSLCFCRGDIDDCMLNTDEAIVQCEHWRSCDQDYGQEDDLDDREE